MKILIATGNPHKLKELLAILPRQTKTGESLQYVSLADFPQITLPPETGTTLKENAKIKALSAAQLTGCITLSDDTGLEVDFLEGRPGVYTARYGGEPVSAEANNQKLLAELLHVPLPQRTARFHTVACLATPKGTCYYFDGILSGAITTQYCGTNGFGYDPIFLVAQTNKTLAEMTDSEKNAVSHRGKAFRQLGSFLQENKII